VDDTRKTYLCRNCGLNGHVYKLCPQPIVSFGLICYRHIHGVPEYLMIQRKDSLSFMEFVRGKYDPKDYQYISKLMSHMTVAERSMLLEKTFENMWNHIWFQKAIQRHTTDFDEASRKFQQLVAGVEVMNADGTKRTHTLSSLVASTQTPFMEPEWGFPKGRRRIRESDVGCAIREFCEETGFSPKDLRMCDGIKPFEEVFYGTNGVLYRHVYFIAELVSNCEREVVIDPHNISQAREVQRANWFAFEDVLQHIRTHNLERKELFACAHKAVVGLCGTGA
jgi:8-oxo-dGTP pyrophosphatase MutT (NUDIX family)